jgi:hypothetical protein
MDAGGETSDPLKRANPVREHNTRTKSKQAAVVALLNRPQGATIAAIIAAGLRPDAPAPSCSAPLVVTAPLIDPSLV